MAGAVRHLVQRGDGFWARVVVPKELRAIIGKTELRTPLGSNRKIAEREVYAAVAGFHDVLSAARAKLEVSASPPPQLRTRPLTTAQLAHRHFAEELAHDEAARNQPDREAAPDMAWTRQEFAKRLKRVAAGHADNDTIAATVGWAIQKFQERGNTKVEDGTIEWRTLARMLAQVQLEAVDAAIERDAGREPSPPKLPIFAEPPTPAAIVPLRKRDPAVPILDLLDGYLRMLKVQGKGAEAERRWRPVFKALVRYLGHDDAQHVFKQDIAGWRDHLVEVEKLAPKTIRDVHLSRLALSGQRMPAVIQVLAWASGLDHGGQVSRAGERRADGSASGAGEFARARRGGSRSAVSFRRFSNAVR